MIFKISLYFAFDDRVLHFSVINKPLLVALISSSPAAGLCYYAPENCEIFVIDPAKPETHSGRTVHYITKKATAGMEEFARLIGFDLSK